MRKEPENEQEIEDKIFKEIETVFEKYKISALLDIPEYGVYSMYYDSLGKLKLLDFAKYELRKKDLQNEEDAKASLNDRNYTPTEKELFYVA